MDTLLFMSAFGLQEIIMLLIVPIFWIIVLLILRVFFLWYWKVNVIVENQEKQIKLLTELLAANRPGSKEEKTEVPG